MRAWLGACECVYLGWYEDRGAREQMHGLETVTPRRVQPGKPRSAPHTVG